MRVLVIDEVGRMGPLTRVLKADYIVQHATYAGEVDHVLERDRPQAIFVNVKMGVRLIRRVRARCPSAFLIATAAEHPPIHVKRRVCEACDLDAFLELEEVEIASVLLDRLLSQAIRIQ